MSSRRRRHARSPAAGPLDDDDLLSEILLRLPPQPSSLPRAGAVCKSWRLLVSDPRFVRRFRIHHCRHPPLLGFFNAYAGSFRPALEAPNRVPPGRFALQTDDGGHFWFRSLGCRHGLVLIFDHKHSNFLVSDPVTGLQRRLAIPPGLGAEGTLINGAVLRAAGDVHFQVILVATDVDKMPRQALARVYSSQTGVWGNLISTPLPPELEDAFPYRICTLPAVLVGNCLYWILAAGARYVFQFGESEDRQILEFDLGKQSLAVIPMPMDVSGQYFTVMRGEGGGLGFLAVSESDFTAQLWRRKMDCDHVASWEAERTIDLNKLLSLNLEEREHITLRFAEENNLVVLCTVIGIYTIHLESLQFKKLSETNAFEFDQPFECIYTAETGNGGGHGAADLLQNT